MKRVINFFKYLNYQAKKYQLDILLLSQIKSGTNSLIEYPFFQIEGVEFIILGSNSSIGKNAWLSCYKKYYEQKFAPRITIGDNVRIGNYACITAIDKIVIGDGCLFSDHVYISDHAHSINPEVSTPLLQQPLEPKGAVTIGNNCFIGMRVTIMPNVTIGSNCIVGAHSVVTKSFPPFSMIAGCPAKVIKKFSIESQNWETIKND